MMERSKSIQPAVSLPKRSARDGRRGKKTKKSTGSRLANTNTEKSMQPIASGSGGANGGDNTEENDDFIENLVNFKRILCTKYFDIMSKDNEKLSAICKNCMVIVRDDVRKISNLLRHLRVCIGLVDE